MLVDEGERVRLCRDPGKPNGARQISTLLWVLDVPLVVVVVVVGVVRGSVLVAAVGAAFALVVFALGRLARIDWSLEVSAEEVRFVRVPGLTVRPRTIAFPRAQIDGYLRWAPYRSSIPVRLQRTDHTRGPRGMSLSTEVGTGEEIDAAFARFAIPRLET